MPEVVIAPLHGIRTTASWQRTLSDAAQAKGWRCALEIWNYGRFSLLRFLMPWQRETKICWFRKTYTAFLRDSAFNLNQNNLPSIVAHSFGTYILGYALLKYDNIRFDKVILCASILPRDFPWQDVLDRGQVTVVRNEYGRNDLPCRIAPWFIKGAGTSGQEGFWSRHDLSVQNEFHFTHSEYFERGLRSPPVPLHREEVRRHTPTRLFVCSLTSPQYTLGIIFGVCDATPCRGIFHPLA